MATLPLIPFPESQIRQNLSKDDWSLCVEAWSMALTKYLYLPDREYEQLLYTYRPLVNFLSSYVHEVANSQDLRHQKNILQNLSFRLIHRSLLTPSISEINASFAFLSNVCIVYGKSRSLRISLRKSWTTRGFGESSQFIEHRKTLQASSDLVRTNKLASGTLLRQVAALLLCCPEYGKFLMSGSDIIDWLITSWNQSLEDTKRRLGIIAYLALKSLLDSERANVSSLLDHLYDLKTRAEKGIHNIELPFLQFLISQTPLLPLLQRQLPEIAKTRAKPIITYLTSIKDRQIAKRHRIRKGKCIETSNAGVIDTQDLHFHQISLISQVQELFPELGAGYVAKLLDEYSDNVESVTVHLLEDDLPDHLASAVRSESLRSPSEDETNSFLEPHPTLFLPARKNVFDGDDFDRLAITPGKLYIGKKEPNYSVERKVDKAKIYASLAAFDADEDERDDTYDVQDVGGSIDVQAYDKDREEKKPEANNKLLYLAWKNNPSVFDRHKTARLSHARQALRTETGMTDEAIEGFAIMLLRDKKRLAVLEAEFSEFNGEQESLATSRWRAYGDGQGSSDNEEAPNARHQGRGRALRRGSRRGNRGGGKGNVAGSTSEKETQAARQKKDENKASRANHSRRAGHARKLAKVGLPG